MRHATAELPWVGFVFSLVLFVLLVVVLALLPSADGRSSTGTISMVCPVTDDEAQQEPSLGIKLRGVARGMHFMEICNPTDGNVTGHVVLTDLRNGHEHFQALEPLEPGASARVEFAVPDEYGTWEIRIGETLPNGEVIERSSYQRVERSGCSGWRVQSAGTLAEFDQPPESADKPGSVACIIDELPGPTMPVTLSATALGIERLRRTRA